MATLREIRRRIQSVRNISHVTRAMEAVAASKMRRAQAQTLASRAYAQKAWEMLSYLAIYAREAPLHPLLQEREPVERIALVLVTPDRGLCGGLPTSIIHRAVRFIQEQRVPVELITVGRKGRDFMLRHGPPIHADFTGIPDSPSLVDVTPIARLAIDGFLEGTFDQVYLCYADFVNVLTQRPVVRRLLPIVPAVEVPWRIVDYIFEPDPATILGEVVPRFTQLQVYQAILEALASEHSARMVAMRNATDNAEALIEDLTLTFNKARQEAITKEMMDIAGGAEALAKAR
ncbi:MAG TPA: ATP synthase F1 subunit gamma [Anaerolineae bacterium]|nr:ATP synthase F1 subunit gamma [Anaerolineae bacterium]